MMTMTFACLLILCYNYFVAKEFSRKEWVIPTLSSYNVLTPASLATFQQARVLY